MKCTFAYEMDLSGLGPGTYHIVVPGLARSDTFHVGGQPVFEIYSEFTTHQTVGPAAMLYATLYALEEEAGTVTKNVRPQFPLGARDRRYVEGTP